MVNTHLYFKVMLERVKDTWVYDRPLGFYNVQSDQIKSDQSFSRVHSLQPHESQHARPPCPSPTPGVHSDSRPSSQ